jgi:hypothetical protein
VAAATLAALGRITGYQLDYSSGAPTGSPGLYQAQTEVELYSSSAAAAAGLAFWGKDETDQLGVLRSAGIVVTMTPFAPAGVAGHDFGFAGVVNVKGKPPFYGADIDFQIGSLVGKVSIGAGDARVPRQLAVTAALKLSKRIAQVLTGRLTGPPPNLPANLRPAVPAHGPNLAGMALLPEDLGPGVIRRQGYQLDPSLNPVSEFERDLAPAGPFAIVTDQLTLFRSPTQASFYLTVLGRMLESGQVWKAKLGGLGSELRSYLPEPVAVRVGDESNAVFGLARLKDGRTFSMALIFIRTGSTLEFLLAATPVGARVSTLEVDLVAAVAANRARHPRRLPGISA